MSGVGHNIKHQKICQTVFVVRNIAPNGKRIRIFNYPIGNGLERDLLAIPYVSEADIRHALLKGELLIKLLAKEIIIADSNIDLLQFDDTQKLFLTQSGVLKGLEITGVPAILPFLFKQGVILIGDQDGINNIFTTPDKFINGTLGNNKFRILVSHNGREMVEGIDFIIAESGGSGTGYDTLIFKCTIPEEDCILSVDYMTEA